MRLGFQRWSLFCSVCVFVCVRVFDISRFLSHFVSVLVVSHTFIFVLLQLSWRQMNSQNHQHSNFKTLSLSLSLHLSFCL